MKTYAIIGASKNTQKYGYKVMKFLKELNEKVIPINPFEKEILGEKVFFNVNEITQKIDTILFITQPEVTLKVLKEINKENIPFIWFQPGSENLESINYCKKYNILFSEQKCIMVEKLKKNKLA
ncbi:MAG: CoA-binding protein [Candidatus ainarchaeum sp.]|nr:CoA-binding protein [Candidatus ainarchaeum sp.]